MQIVKGLTKGEPTFIFTIGSSRKHCGVKDPFPLIVKKVLKEKKDVMPHKLQEMLPLLHQKNPMT